MQERAFNNSKIEICWNATVIELLGEHKLAGAVVRDVVLG